MQACRKSRAALRSHPAAPTRDARFRKCPFYPCLSTKTEHTGPIDAGVFARMKTAERGPGFRRTDLLDVDPGLPPPFARDRDSRDVLEGTHVYHSPSGRRRQRNFCFESLVERTMDRCHDLHAESVLYP